MNSKEQSTAAELSVIIVNWNSRDYLRKCLASLFASEWRTDWEVVVIDNGSYDGCGEMLAAEFPQVRFIQGKENAGFAAANNIAFENCCGRYVLFLNPDTEVVGQACSTLLRFLQNTPDAGAVGARLLNSDGSLQTSCIQRFPTILNQALDFDGLRNLLPRARLFGTGPLYAAPDTAAPTEVISGACLMLPRPVFEQVGMFSTRYFMYAEDVDLCWKVRRAGSKNYFVGAATVVHHGGQSTVRSGTSFSSVVMRESRWLFLRASRGEGYATGYRLSVLWAAVTRLLLLALVFVATWGRFRGAYLRSALLRWYKVLRWSLGMESWAGTLRQSAQSPASGEEERGVRGLAQNASTRLGA